MWQHEKHADHVMLNNTRLCLCNMCQKYFVYMSTELKGKNWRDKKEQKRGKIKSRICRGRISQKAI